MFLDTIKRDLQFLAKNMLMDYSLLVGVHDIAEHDYSQYEAIGDPWGPKNGVYREKNSNNKCIFGDFRATFMVPL